MQGFILFKFFKCSSDFYDGRFRDTESEIGMDSSKRGVETNQEFISDFVNLGFVFDRVQLPDNGEHLVGKWNDTDGRIMREQVEMLAKVHSGGWCVFLVFSFEGSPCFSSRFDLNDRVPTVWINQEPDVRVCFLIAF